MTYPTGTVPSGSRRASELQHGGGHGHFDDPQSDPLVQSFLATHLLAPTPKSA